MALQQNTQIHRRKLANLQIQFSTLLIIKLIVKSIRLIRTLAGRREGVYDASFLFIRGGVVGVLLFFFFFSLNESNYQITQDYFVLSSRHACSFCLQS